MEPNYILITTASIIGATGLALIFVGTLMAMLVALGNKHYMYGVVIFLCFPVALIYALQHKKGTSYPNTLLVLGAVLFSAFLLALWWELNRLGLDFAELMLNTKPVH